MSGSIFFVLCYKLSIYSILLLKIFLNIWFYIYLLSSQAVCLISLIGMFEKYSYVFTPCSLLHTPYSLLPAPYSLIPTPYSRLPTPYSLLPTPYSLYSLLPTPYSLLPTPSSLLPTLYLGSEYCTPLFRHWSMADINIPLHCQGWKIKC